VARPRGVEPLTPRSVVIAITGIEADYEGGEIVVDAAIGVPAKGGNVRAQDPGGQPYGDPGLGSVEIHREINDGGGEMDHGLEAPLGFVGTHGECV
jgi:hypothetical protein